MIQEQQRRFYQAPFYPYIEHQAITLGGVGGVGSWLAVILAKMGFPTVTCFDYDVVEEVNLGGQLYSTYQSGITAKKVESIQRNVENYSTTSENWKYKEEFNENSQVTPICIAAFDNMATRKLMFEKWKNADFTEHYDLVEDRLIDLTLNVQSGKASSIDKSIYNRLTENTDKDLLAKDVVKKLFIDVRMIAEAFQIFVVSEDNMDEYEEHLFDDSEVPDQDCSYRATTYVGAISAGMIAGAIANNLSGMKSQLFNDYDMPIII